MNFVNVWRNSHVYLKFKRNVTMSFSTHDINMSRTEKYTSDISTSDKSERDYKLLPRIIDESKRRSISSIKPNNKDKTNSDSYRYSYSYPEKASRIRIMLLDNKLTKMNQKFDFKNNVGADNGNIIKKSKTSENIYVKTTRDKGVTRNKEDISLINENISSESNASSVMSIKQTSDLPIHDATSSCTFLHIIPFPVYNTEKNLSSVQDKKNLVISNRDYLETIHYPSINAILAVTKSRIFQNISDLEKIKLIIELRKKGFKKPINKEKQEKYSYLSSIQNILKGIDIEIPDNVKLAINSISNILNELEDVTAINSHVSHKCLFYRGLVNCIAKYRGKLYIIHWDNCQRRNYSRFYLYNAWMRLAAVIGAVNYSKDYPMTIDQGLLVVGYMDGRPAEVYELTTSNLVINWNRWLLQLKKYYTHTSRLNSP